MTPPTKNGTLSMVKMGLSALVGAVIVVVVGQFVPVLQTTTASATDISHLEKRMTDNFAEVRKDIAALDKKIEDTMVNHKEATAHKGALQILIQHGTALSDHEARLKALERGGHP